MSILVVTRWTGALQDVVRNAGKAKALQLKHGAEDFRVSQIYTGPNAGQWIVTARWKSLEAWGAAQPKLMADPKFAAVMKEAQRDGQLLEREILMSVDV